MGYINNVLKNFSSGLNYLVNIAPLLEVFVMGGLTYLAYRFQKVQYKQREETEKHNKIIQEKMQQQLEQEKIRNRYFDPMIVKVYFDKVQHQHYRFVGEKETLLVKGKQLVVEQLQGSVANARLIIDDGKQRGEDILDTTKQVDSGVESRDIKITFIPTLLSRAEGKKYPEMKFGYHYLLLQGMNKSQKELYLIGYLVDGKEKKILKQIIFDEVSIKLYLESSALSIEGTLLDVSNLDKIEVKDFEDKIRESYGKQLLANGMKHELENYVKLAKDLGTWNE